MLRIITSVVLALLITNCYSQTINLNLRDSSDLYYTQNVNDVKSEVEISIDKSLVLVAPMVIFFRVNKSKYGKFYQCSDKSVNSSNILYLGLDSISWPPQDVTISIISKRSFEEITKGKTVFKINGGAATGFELSGKEMLPVVINGKTEDVEAYHLKNADNVPAQELWILNNANNPIILKAKGVYNLELTEVKL